MEIKGEIKMKNYEATGKTYEEALENGLSAMGATISDVDITSATTQKTPSPRGAE